MSLNIDLFPLLPDMVLGKEFICSRECHVVMNVRVPFERIPNGRSEFRQPGLSFLLLFSPQAIGVLSRKGQR